MGCESFQVLLKSNRTFFNVIEDYLRNFQEITLSTQHDDDTLISRYYTYRTGRFCIDVRVMCKSADMMCDRIECLFALCNPVEVEDAFVSFITKLAKFVKMDILIDEDYPPFQDKLLFVQPDYHNLENVIKEVIDYRRKQWIADFGDAIAPLSCPEAIQKIIVSKCKPE